MEGGGIVGNRSLNFEKSRAIFEYRNFFDDLFVVIGLDITDEQIAELESSVMNIDYDKAEKKEADTRHDVMAHVYTYGDLCPKVSICHQN